MSYAKVLQDFNAVKGILESINPLVRCFTEEEFNKVDTGSKAANFLATAPGALAIAVGANTSIIADLKDTITYLSGDSGHASYVSYRNRGQ